MLRRMSLAAWLLASGWMIVGCGAPVSEPAAEVPSAEEAPSAEAAPSPPDESKSQTETPTPPDSDSPENPDSPEDESSKRMLSISDPLTEEEKKTPVDDMVTMDQIAAKAFDPPPNAKPLSRSNLWIDPSTSRVYMDGYIAMTDGPLEMFACPAGTKEHESIVAVLPKAKEVHAALLAVGAQAGTPVRFLPKFVPATGQRIRVWVCYRDEDGKFRTNDARQWIRREGTDELMDIDWVFAGSGFWTDPDDNRQYYRADAGDMICVSNFSTAMLDVPVASSAEASDLLYSPMTPKIPSRGTPVRLVLVPIPLPTDEDAEPDSTDQSEAPGKIDAMTPPSDDVLPKRS